ncbi:MAG: hypothetical protein PHH98_05010 [Candidatus Gracilibacteria bacterium]|nr:hypothetical protein [Candidatus Gracilibacteria bacterium]
MNLEEENKELKKKLLIAQSWMEREVKTQINLISKEKISNLSSGNIEDFFHENVEEIITTGVHNFFGELMILNTPKVVMENIIGAEILFYNQRQNKFADGLGIISSYHKSIDYIIESTITKPFRKYAKKHNQTILRRNDPLEKTLNLVVNSGYILGIAKLFHALSLIKKGENLSEFTKCFSEFLDNHLYIKDILLEDNFYKLLKILVDSEVFGKKRHEGKITYEETKKTRTILIGDLKEQDCVIYKLIKMGQVDI